MRAKRASPTPRTVWAPLAEVRLERVVCDFRVGRHPWESLRAVSMLAREREPLGGVGIGGDCVGAVTYLDGVAVGTDRVRLAPGADAIAQDLAAVIFEQTNLRALHRRFPLALPFGFLALPRETLLLGFDGLRLELAQQLR